MNTIRDSAFSFTFAEANVGYGKFNDPNSKWNRLQQSLYQKITTMATDIPQIERKLNSEGKSEETKLQKDRIFSDLNRIKTIVDEVSSSLKEIKEMIATTKDQRLKQERQLIVDRISKDFQGWLKVFNNISQLWIAEEKKANAETKKGLSLGVGVGNKFLNFFTGGKRDEERQPLTQQQQQQLLLENEVDYYESVILEREKGIREVERNILEVNEIYQDLGNLIEFQGDMISSIEAHIETAKEEIEVGYNHLENAAGHQKSANSKVYLIALICAVIIIFICGIVFIVVKVMP